jgi:hypothetical protein
MTLTTIVNFALAILAGAYLIRQARHERPAPGAQVTVRERRTRLLRSGAYVSITAGILAVFAYVTKSELGPRWLHAAALPTSVTLIVGGYLLAAAVGWREGRTGR